MGTDFTRKWLGHILIGTITVITLIVLIVTHPWTNTSATDSARQTIKIKSGQMAVFTCAENGTEQQIIELDWVFPDRQRGKITDYGETSEFIIIHNQYYYKGPEIFYPERAYIVARNLLYRIYDKGKNELLDSLVNVQELSSEEIQGITCSHRIATVNMNRYVDNVVESIIQELEEIKTSKPDLYNEFDIKEFKESLSQFRENNIAIEYWLGASDGIFRQIKIEPSELLVMGTQFFDVTGFRVIYYNINQSVIINPPTNLFGKLRSGWCLYTFPP